MKTIEAGKFIKKIDNYTREHIASSVAGIVVLTGATFGTHQFLSLTSVSSDQREYLEYADTVGEVLNDLKHTNRAIEDASIDKSIQLLEDKVAAIKADPVYQDAEDVTEEREHDLKMGSLGLGMGLAGLGFGVTMHNKESRKSDIKSGRRRGFYS